MEYTLRLPVMAGDAIPLFIVADAMARSDATGRGTLALHGPTLRERRPTRNAQLVAAAKNGALIVCNSEGVATSAGALIHAAGFPTAPLTVGPSGKVHQFTEIDALFVRSKHLNDWSQKDGDVFHVIDMPVQVVEFGPQDERGEFAFRGMVGLPVAADTQPQTGNDAPVVKVPASEPPPLTTGDIAFCFAGLRWKTEKEWKDALGKQRNWIEVCVAVPAGGRGRGVAPKLWNPVLIGAALLQQGYTKANSIRARFQTMYQLKPWLDAWKTYEADNLDTV